MQTRDRPALLPPLVLLLGIGVLEALLLRTAGPPSSHFHVLTDLLSSPVSSRPPRPTGRQDAIDTTREASPPPPGASAAGPAPGSTAHDPSQPGSATATMRHTVEPGDTLWDIGAAHLPADARAETIITRYWRRIYGANRGALGPDPDLVRPGVTLSIPPYASTAAVPVSQDAPRATAPTWPQPGDRTDAPPYRLP